MAAKPPVSLKQLAKMAQVSTATISRVLNNTGRFSEDTRARVEALIRETGYVPNVTAKALRTKTARAVGLVIPDIVNEFFAAMVDRMGRFFFERDYSLFVCNAGEDPRKNRVQITSLMGKGVDGLICVSRFPVDPEEFAVPVVLLDRVLEAGCGIPMVTSDNHQGGRLAARALAEAGSVRPVILCAPGDLDGLSTISGRIAGFAEGMRECGVEWSEKDIILSPLNVAETRKNVARSAARGRRFDGIFATLDLGAMGAVLGLEDAGLRVPDDVNVVGFDDIPLSVCCRPALTTIHQDTAAMADTAAKMLLKAMVTGKNEPVHVQIPVRLVVRDSTRPMRAGRASRLPGRSSGAPASA